MFEFAEENLILGTVPTLLEPFTQKGVKCLNSLEKRVGMGIWAGIAIPPPLPFRGGAVDTQNASPISELR